MLGLGVGDLGKNKNHIKAQTLDTLSIVYKRISLSKNDTRSPILSVDPPDPEHDIVSGRIVKREKFFSCKDDSCSTASITLVVVIRECEKL